MKLHEVSRYCADFNSAKDFLREKGILRRDIPRCSECYRLMTEVKYRHGGELIWRCPSHKSKKLSLRDGSFLQRQGISLQDFIMVVYFWARQIPVKTTAEMVGLSRSTSITWYSHLRDVCSKHLVTHPVTGGPDHINVQVEESVKRKNQQGRVDEVMWRQQYGRTHRDAFDNILLHISLWFPRNARKRQNWLKQMTDSSLASAFSVICSEHFEDSSFRYLNGKRLVKDEAFPTKFLRSKKKTEITRVSPGLPTKTDTHIDNLTKVDHEHNNSMELSDTDQSTSDEQDHLNPIVSDYRQDHVIKEEPSSQKETEITRLSPGLPIQMTFPSTETDTHINNLAKVDHEHNSMELSDTDQTTSDEQDHLNPIVSEYGQDLVIKEEPSSQVDLEKSGDQEANIEVANFPESSEQIIYPTEANLSRECISPFNEEVHLEIASDLTGHIQTSFQPSPVHPAKKLTNLKSDETNNKTVSLKDNITCEKIDLLAHKNHKVKAVKDYRGPSKKAKFAITLFRKAMRLSGLGLDVFLVVQEFPHCPTYWGTKRFTNKFMLSKPLVDFKKTKCYNAEECYNFSSPDESKKHSVDDEAVAKFPDPLLDADDHTYSLCNNTKDGHWKASTSGQTIDNPTKDALHDDLLHTSNPSESSLDDEGNIVQRPEKNCLSDKIDQLIAQNDKICSMWSVLSACKANKEKKIFRLPSANSYNPKDNSMKDFDIGQEFVLQQSKKRTNVSQNFGKKSKKSKHNRIK